MGQLLENVLVSLMAEKGYSRAFIAPEAVHDVEGDEHAGGAHRLDLAEFAGIDAALNDSAEELEPAGDDVLREELGEVWELVELANHEPVDGDEGRRANVDPVGAHGGDELLGRRSGGDRPFAGLDRGDGGLPDHLAKQLFLVGEVEVDGAFGDTGAVGDIL